MGVSRAFFLPLFCLPLAAQTTLNVPADHPTIQDAIGAAVDGDTVLVAPGTYHEQIDFLGKAITVRSLAGPEVTTIDSQGRDDWPDFPHGPVVRMIQGEREDSVLEGFTVTGGAAPFPALGHSGIWCQDLSPTIRRCVVRGNRGGIGGGVFGDARIVGCVITENDSMPFGDGGGVYGQPTILDSRITHNRSGGLGGGVYASGPCSIVGTVIDANVAGNGVDGYSGGGVFGPATLIDCQITRNSAHHYFSGGPPDIIGAAVDGPQLLRGCTISDNFIANSLGGHGGIDNRAGAVRNVGEIVDSILWDNKPAPIAVGSNPDVTYSIVEGGYPGTGNLDRNPLFRNPGAGNYRLRPGSPAIDAGDPASPPDPDGTRADMGAYFFPQFRHR